MYQQSTQVHPSFSSKLVATIDPHKPVYDSQVLSVLGLKVNAGLPAAARLECAIENFVAIETSFRTALESPAVEGLLEAFDQRFGRFAYFSPTKKLDLFLWKAGSKEALAFAAPLDGVHTARETPE